jgi:hypothetical protein
MMLRWLVLMLLAPSLGGCVFIYFAAVATVPAPRRSIDVTWADDAAVCRAAIEGRTGHMKYIGEESHHFGKVSSQSLTERRYEVWRVPTDDPSFLLLGGTGRAVFDFDNDGQIDLVYTRGDAIFVGPATRRVRDAFESGSLPEQALTALDMHVYERTDFLKRMSRATSVSIQRVDGVTYLRAKLPDVPFDASRPTAPRYETLYGGGQPNDKMAWPEDLYRIGPDGTTRKVCTFLVQTSEYAIGGF